MMTIEKQVVSLELSKRLKELGCEQESLFGWVQFSNGYAKGHRSYETKLHWEIRYDKGTLYNFPERIAAFTCAELGEMLPHDNRFISTVKMPLDYGVDNMNGKWCGLIRSKVEIIQDTEADARAKILCYLLEHGLM